MRNEVEASTGRHHTLLDVNPSSHVKFRRRMLFWTAPGQLDRASGQKRTYFMYGYAWTLARPQLRPVSVARKFSL